MKHTALYLLVAIMMMAVGCEDLHIVIKDSGTYHLNAVVEETEPATRVGFDWDSPENGVVPFFWTKGDAIAVMAKMGNTLSMYVTNDETGSPTATFTGYVKATGYAVYPYMEAHAIRGDKLEYIFPAIYEYTSVDTDFFNGMSVSVPMLAKLSEGDNSAKFKHLGGLIAFKFSNLPAGNNQKVIITSDQQIAGLTRTDLTADVPEIRPIQNPGTDDREVVITFSLSEAQAGVFYLPVPVGVYEIGISLIDSDGKETFKTGWKGLNVTRAKILYTNLNPDNIEGGGEGGSGSVEGGEGDITFENGNATVDTVTPDADGNATFSLPKAEGDAGQPHTLTFSNIADGVKTIEIQEQDNVAGNPIENLNIAIPGAAGGIDLKIDLPNTTVTLVPENGALILGNVEASTAENTLKIGSGVSINKLIIKKGNVVVADGANISAIEKHQDNSAAVAYAYFEKTKPSLTATGVELLTFEEHLRAGIEAGGEVKLLGDIALNSPLTIPSGKEVILNLDGKTLSQEKECTAAYQMILNRGTLTVTGNGKISFKDTGSGDLNLTWGSYTISNYGNLIVNNGRIENITQISGHTTYVIDNYSAENNSLTINGGTIESINGTVIRMGAFSTQQNASNNVTINGGSISGKNRAIILQHPRTTSTYPAVKNLSINGGTISSQMDANYFTIYVYSSGQSAEKVKIDITDGTIGSIGLYGQGCTMDIRGGNFNGAYGVYDYSGEVSYIQIYGGKFLVSDYAKYYLAEGYELVYDGSQYYEVRQVD